MEEEKYYKAMAAQAPGVLGRELNQASTPPPPDMRQLILSLHNEVSNLCNDFHMLACDLCGPDHIGGPRLLDQPENIVDGLKNSRAMVDHMQSVLYSVRKVYFHTSKANSAKLMSATDDPITRSLKEHGLY